MRVVSDRAAQKGHMAPCLNLGEAADAALAHRPASGMSMEAVPDETGSCEHICRSRRATALTKKPSRHILEQSSCAVEARKAGTAAGVAKADEVGSCTEDQPCNRR